MFFHVCSVYLSVCPAVSSSVCLSVARSLLISPSLLQLLLYIPFNSLLPPFPAFSIVFPFPSFCLSSTLLSLYFSFLFLFYSLYENVIVFYFPLTFCHSLSSFLSMFVLVFPLFCLSPALFFFPFFPLSFPFSLSQYLFLSLLPFHISLCILLSLFLDSSQLFLVLLSCSAFLLAFIWPFPCSILSTLCYCTLFFCCCVHILALCHHYAQPSLLTFSFSWSLFLCRFHSVLSFSCILFICFFCLLFSFPNFHFLFHSLFSCTLYPSLPSSFPPFFPLPFPPFLPFLSTPYLFFPLFLYLLLICVGV